MTVEQYDFLKLFPISIIITIKKIQSFIKTIFISTSTINIAKIKNPTIKI